jgi:cytochrome P450
MALATRYEFPPTPEIMACPWPAYAELRAERPVFQAAGGEFIISRHADIREIMRQPEVFDNPSRTNHPKPNMLEIEGPAHKQRRLALSRLVSPRRMRDNEAMIRAQAEELIDGFIADGEVEFVMGFAVPFPAFIVPKMMGLEDHDTDWFLKWATGGLQGAALNDVDDEAGAAHKSGWDYVYNYARKCLQERVDHPRDDLLTELLDIQRRELGDIDLDALMADVGVTIGGGVHTTSAMIANTMLLLLRDPELLARAKAEPAMIPRLLEESLRLEAPVQWQPRTAVTDTEVAGTPIPAGSRLILLFGSGNRDDEAFTCPAQFDASRPDVTKHLSFGFGPHVCFGAPLARLEGKIAFETLLRRLDDLRLTDGEDSVKLHLHPEHRTLDALDISFAPAASAQ